MHCCSSKDFSTNKKNYANIRLNKSKKFKRINQKLYMLINK